MSPSAKLPDVTCLWHCCFCIFFLVIWHWLRATISIKSSANSFVVVFISSWISPTSIFWNTLPLHHLFLSYLHDFLDWLCSKSWFMHNILNQFFSRTLLFQDWWLSQIFCNNDDTFNGIIFQTFMISLSDFFHITDHLSLNYHV